MIKIHNGSIINAALAKKVTSAQRASINRGQGVITPSEICLILHILRKPNSLIALLFIQNNSWFQNIAETCLPASMLRDGPLETYKIYNKNINISRPLQVASSSLTVFTFPKDFALKWPVSFDLL